MSLQDWLGKGWLVEHRPSSAEIGDLLGLVDRDLRDSQVPGLTADWRLNIAYNAALQAATAALAASGYRATRKAHHMRVIQSLAFTVGWDKALITTLDGFRRMRNINDYERAGFVSDGEAEEMLALAKRLRVEVLAWIREKHPAMVPENKR
jgi:hypothetical protein